MLLRNYFLVMFVILLVSPAAQADGLSHIWSQRFGDADEQFRTSVTVDSLGSVIVVGDFLGTVDFGGGTLTSAGGIDIFVVKFDSNGTHIWSQRFGDANSQYASSVAVDSSGNVVVVGYFYGTVDFGGGTLTSAGGRDIFVAKFNPSGTHGWSQRFGDSDHTQKANSVTVDSLGNVIVTGHFTGTMDFGGGTLTSAGSYDIFIVKFNPSGTHLWSKSFGDSDMQFPEDITVDSAGNVILTGSFYSFVDFGGGGLTSAGSEDIFLVKFDSSGTNLWSQRFGDSDAEAAKGVSVDSLGNVIITGYFGSFVDFGGGGVLTSAGWSDIFVAKFEPFGTHLWSQRFGDSQDEAGEDVAVDGAGNVILTGAFSGTVDFGGGVLTSAGIHDIFIAKFDPTGLHLVSRRFGDSDEQLFPSVTVDSPGNVIVTGEFLGTMDFGGGPLASAGAWDIFLAKFAPISVCHDGYWDFGEFCGYDAYQTTGFGEMNHDCYVNLMDLQLFAYDYAQSGPELSGDLDGDDVCDLMDLLAFAEHWQDSVLTCTRSGMLTDTLQGSIALSFSSDSTNTVSRGPMGIGVDTVYVVIDGYGELGSVEYTVETSSNIMIVGHERSYDSAFSGYDWTDYDPDFTHSYKATVAMSPVPEGPINIGYVIIYRTDNAIGWMHLIDFTWPTWHDCYLRWNNVAANRTYYFEEVSHATIDLVSGIGSEDPPEPLEFTLRQNIPNPFNPLTTISFTLPEKVHATLCIFNSEGRLIKTLVNETLDKGIKEVTWDGTDAQGHSVASGVYFYRMKAPGYVQTRKMVLLK